MLFLVLVSAAATYVVISRQCCRKPRPGSQPSSSATASTSELSTADRHLFVASKFANYVKFVTSLVSYLPEISSWAGALKYTPWAAFQLQVEVTFRQAVEAHRRGDNQGRDTGTAAIVRKTATDHGFDVLKLKAPDYAKLIRYASLFVILCSEDSLM